jgi:hypothetical protein
VAVQVLDQAVDRPGTLLRRESPLRLHGARKVCVDVWNTVPRKVTPLGQVNRHRSKEVPMAIIARFSFDVPFGKKAELFKLSKKWDAFGTELGFPKPEVLVGSIGTPESRVEFNHRFESLAALEAVWGKLDNPKMQEYQREMGAFVVPGSHRWEILRIQPL